MPSTDKDVENRATDGPQITRRSEPAARLDASEDGSVVAVISTDDMARDKGVLLSSGARLDNYRKNPVFLWSHDRWKMPIGSAEWVKQSPNKSNPTEILAKFRFASTMEGMAARTLFEEGHLRSFSVSWRPIDQSEPTEDELKENPRWKKDGVQWVGRDWELEEVSAVSVPALPQAVVVEQYEKGNLTGEFCRTYLGVDPASRTEPTETVETEPDPETETVAPEPEPESDTTEPEPEREEPVEETRDEEPEPEINIEIESVPERTINYGRDLLTETEAMRLVESRMDAIIERTIPKLVEATIARKQGRLA